MLSRFADKNKYGGYTYQIDIDAKYRIHIHGTDSISFVMDFKEFRWLRFNTIFSFVSADNLEETIKKAFDRVASYFQGKPGYNWSEAQKLWRLNQILQQLDQSKYC